jgi:transcriptional regulator with XRE-family HTH domain
LMQDALARKLRVLRAERGLTLREAAQRTGVDKDTLSKIERGLRHPYDVTLSKLAKGYGVPVEELLEEPVPLGEAPTEAGPSLLEKALDAVRRDDAKDARAINRLVASEGVLEATGVSGYAEDAFRADLRARGFPDEYFENFLWPLVVMASRTTRRGEEADVLRGRADEYDETLISRSPLTPEVFRGVLEALVEHEHQMEYLSVSMQEGYVEVGLKEPENDALKGSDPAVWGSEESRPRTPMPGSAGKQIDVEIRDDLTSNEPASVTITKTSFFELMRDAKANRLTDEDAWQRLLKAARERSAS